MRAAAARPADGLEMLRGALAAWVVAYHLTKFRGLPPSGALAAACPAWADGLVPVAGFCVLSGFVIAAACERLAGLDDLSSYAARRAARILPVLLAALAATLALSHSPGAGVLIHEATGFGILGIERAATLNETLWSVYGEMAFYAVAPMLVAASLRWRWFSPVAFAMLAVADRTSGDFWAHQWKFFVAGIALRAFCGNLVAAVPARAALTAAGAAAVSLSSALGDPLNVALAVAGGTPTAAATILTPSVALGFCAVVLALSGTRPPRSALLVPLRFLGAVSYPLFALHFAVFCLVLGYRFIPVRATAHIVDGFVPGTWWELAAVAVPPAVLVAWAAHVLVERPCMEAAGRRWPSGQR